MKGPGLFAPRYAIITELSSGGIEWMIEEHSNKCCTQIRELIVWKLLSLPNEAQPFIANMPTMHHALDTPLFPDETTNSMTGGFQHFDAVHSQDGCCTLCFPPCIATESNNNY